MESIMYHSKAYLSAFTQSVVQFLAWIRTLPVHWQSMTGRLKIWTSGPWYPLVWALPLVLVVPLLIGSMPWIMDRVPGMLPANRHAVSSLDSAAIDSRILAEEKAIAVLQKDLARLTPKTPYLVINTTNNTFTLYKGITVVREGICSTGSYTLLTDGKEKKWYFETPRGRFRVRYKTVNPVWKKPDWAFVEEGLPVPPSDHPSRIEYGTLGDYALGLGDGYLIHGTLYQRFLGLPVTHGCVRLGDDDLEVVFRSLPVGAHVFIY